MRFMLLAIPKGYETAGPESVPDAEGVARMMVYCEELHKAGVLLALDGLRPPSMGARVSFPGGKPTVTKGPFPEQTEALGGFWILKVKSQEEAIEWASKAPFQDDAVIEIRQLEVTEDWPEDVREAATGSPEFEQRFGPGSES